MLGVAGIEVDTEGLGRREAADFQGARMGHDCGERMEQIDVVSKSSRQWVTWLSAARLPAG